MQRWRAIEGPELGASLRRGDLACKSTLGLRLASSEARVWELACHPGTRLVRAIDHRTRPPLLRRWAEAGQRAWPLRDAVDLERLNAEAPLRLDVGAVLDYARLLGEVAPERTRSFRFAETIDDVPFIATPDADTRRRIAAALEPLRLVAEENDGFVVEGTATLEPRVARLRLRIRTTGDSEVLAVDTRLDQVPVCRAHRLH